MIRALICSSLAVGGLVSATASAVAATPAGGKVACVSYAKATVWEPGARSAPQQLTVDATGVIVALGQQTTPAASACSVQALEGPFVVTPGLVETTSSIGITEIWLEDDANDSAAVSPKGGPMPIRSSFRAFDAYNPRSTLIPTARAEGVTHVLSLPRGGLISGQAPFMRLRGRLQSEAAVNRSAAMVMSVGMGAGSRGHKLQTARAVLDEARRHLRTQSAKGARRLPAPIGAPGAHGTPFSYYANLTALGPVLTNRQPLLVFAERASDLEALIRLKTEFGLALVIAGASEGWLLAKELAKASIPVIIDPLRYAPGSFDQIHARPDNAKMLARAGVKIIISTFATHDARRLRQSAGNAVRAGLSPDEALRAITWTPREVFGSTRSPITLGAVANLAIWNGDPLEPRTSLMSLWIDGARVSLDTRQKRLMRRYRDEPERRGLSH